MWGLFHVFCPKVALGPALGELCAYLARPQFHLSFGCACFCPVLVLLSCSFLPVCVSASPCIFLSENRSSSFYLFTQCIAMCMFVFLTGRHGLGVNFGPEACAFSCADLGWTILSLAGLLLIVNLQFCLPTYRGDFSTEPAWDCQCDKQKSDAELLSIQNCVEDKYNYHNNMVVS